MAAERIAERIEPATGARLKVVRAEEEAEALLEGHVVALGNMEDNAFIRWLYHRWLAVEDRCYPGSGGCFARCTTRLGPGRMWFCLGPATVLGWRVWWSVLWRLCPMEERSASNG